MIMVNIYEAKAKLSEYLDAAVKGQRVLICKHNHPIAELVPVGQARVDPRDLTPMYPGATFTTPAFFEPFSPNEIAAWEGTRAEAAKVAEQRPGYLPGTGQRRKSKGRR